MTSTRDQLLRILVETGSFKFRPEEPISLASGARSPYYVDCRIALSYPEARIVVGDLILERFRTTHVDGVGGLVVGAYPIAIAVSDAAYRRSGKLLRAFVVRKEPKPHGMMKLIEGDVVAGHRVVIVDDVITSGRSTIDAIERSRAEGLEVVQALAIVDREEQQGRKRIEEMGVSFEALCTLSDLRLASEAGSQRE